MHRATTLDLYLHPMLPMPSDRNARQASPFTGRRESAAGAPPAYSGVFCCSMYWRMILIGAPPQEAAKYEGDHRTPFQYRRSMSGRSRVEPRGFDLPGGR